jgi:tetratricopeptide (TPR) repeat protein
MTHLSRSILLLLALVVVSCGAVSPTPAAPAALPNVLVEAQGQVWLRRAGWNGYQPAAFGAALAPGDLVRVAQGGSAAVFCGDAAQWAENPRLLPADGSEHSVPCQAGRPPRPWAELAALRGENEPDLPYVVWPRDTALLSDRPALRWHAIGGLQTYTAAYTLTLLGDDGQSRPPWHVSGDTQSDWPSSWPALQPGGTYVLVVQAGGLRSDAGNEEHAGLAFYLLSAEEARQVQAQEAQLRAQPLPPAAIDLLVAELYRGHGLRAEAAALLEASAGVRAPAAGLVLGQLYLETGLAAEAQQILERVLEQGADNLEFAAQARVGLGLARRLQNDETGAQEQFAAGRALYEQLGDHQEIAQVDELLGR